MLHLRSINSVYLLLIKRYQSNRKNVSLSRRECQTILRDDSLFVLIINNVFYHYLSHYHYLIHLKILFFTFSPRRRQRRRQQYEIIQKISIIRRLVILKCFFLSRQFQIIEYFNLSILVILHSLFVSFYFFLISVMISFLYIKSAFFENWKIVDKWHFWSTITFNNFHLTKLMNWWLDWPKSRVE
jgi:hypothetical protein